MTARAALAVFALLTIVFTYPLSRRPGSVLLDDQPDFHLFVWTLGWTAHALATNPLGILDMQLYRVMRQFPDAESLSAMRRFGVTHVIVHIDRYQPERWDEVSRRLEGATELELAFQEMKSRVYRLRATASHSTR